jgi:hypothetical protein
MACGLRLVFDRDRGADLLPIDSPVSLGDRTPLSEVGLPPERERSVWSLTFGRGTSLRSLQASQPFTLVRVINGLEGTAE